jgi:hypothetical protein
MYVLNHNDEYIANTWHGTDLTAWYSERETLPGIRMVISTLIKKKIKFSSYIRKFRREHAVAKS